MPALTSFLVPKPRHFGLSVGRTSLRAVEFNKGKVIAQAEVVLPGNVFKNGIVVNKEALVASLKELIAKGKFTTKYVSASFSEAYAYSREYTVPRIPFAEVKEAILWHVKDLFPFPQDDIYFDWKLLNQLENEYKIVVVGVQKQVLDGLLEAIVSVGLKPLGFQPGASVICKLVTLKNDEFAFVTEVNRIGAYVTLIQGEKMLFTTVVAYTPQDTPDSYVKKTNEAVSEMATYYQKKGVLNQKSQVLIILTGELAGEEWVKKSTAYTTYPMRLLKTPIANPAFNKAYAAAVTPLESPSDEKSINLLPTSIQQFYDHEQQSSFYKALLTRANIAFFILLVASFGMFLAITLERQNLDSQVKKLSSQFQSQKAGTQNLLLLNAQAKNIVDLAPLRITPAEKLKVIQSIIPSTIQITQWEYDDSKLLFKLEGEAADRLELLKFKETIENTDEFAKITLPLESLESPKNVNFRLSFIAK